MEKVTRKYKKRAYGDPPCPVPEYINLPDGRKVLVDDVIFKITNFSTINRLTGTKLISGMHRSTRYTMDDRRWIAASSIIDIQEKYNLGLKQARSLRLHSQNLL